MDGNADPNWLEWGFKGLVGVVGTLGAVFMNAMRKKADDAQQAVDDLERATNEKISKLADGFSDYKLYMASTIPTKTEMNQAIMETKDSVKRVHEKIESISDDMGDIKTLIITTMNGNHKSA